MYDFILSNHFNIFNIFNILITVSEVLGVSIFIFFHFSDYITIPANCNSVYIVFLKCRLTLTFT